MLQSPLEIQHSMPTGTLFEYQSEAAFADLNDMNPTESMRKQKRPAKLHSQDHPLHAFYKGSDPDNAVFWVPAQIHPEVAPNEFNSWIAKRAYSLSHTEKPTTRRKSILALHSYTSEQLVKDTKEPSIPESPTQENSRADLPVPTIPLSPSLFRRHTYNSSESANRKDLLIKKEKDEFIVVPKTDAGLKRSARAKPRKEPSVRPNRRQPPEPITKPTPPSISMVPHRKTASEPTFEDTTEKDLLEEINSLLSTKIVDKDKTPIKLTKSLTQNGKANKRTSEVSNVKQKIDKAVPDLFDYFDAPIQEVAPASLSRETSPESASSENTSSSCSPSPPETPEPSLSPRSTLESIASSSISTPQILSPDTKETSLKPIVPQKPAPPRTTSTQANQPSSSRSISPPKNASGRTGKKPFAWFWGNESSGEKKADVPKTPEPVKALPQLPTQKSSSNSKVSFEMESKSKTKPKEKSKMSFFFLGKDKKKNKKTKTKPAFTSPTKKPDLGSHFPICDPCDLPPYVEQQLYRLSHQKLANPKRPLHQQVLISNLMLAYLRTVNPNFRAQQNRPKTSTPTPRPRSPHLISKERYKQGRSLPMSSSSDEDEDSLSDSSSDDDESLGPFGLNKSSRVTLA
ncbi:hypothetical protein DSO57_1003315 [Entomophthora muscae]|uniref:Uncharacterized protein n=1 Tax=Entomophthora muscae TaxID=34485 RepID=A0ACC2T8F0_9FUNG|nr:hypothetical protein DSO57_1003315 [Entomophthora muscae]